MISLGIIILINLTTLTAGEDRVEQEAYDYIVEGFQLVLFMVDKYIWVCGKSVTLSLELSGRKILPPFRGLGGTRNDP